MESSGVRKRRKKMVFQLLSFKCMPIPFFVRLFSSFCVNSYAQFLELYNEDINDLLCSEKSTKSQIKIREDADGGMYLMVRIM